MFCLIRRVFGMDGRDVERVLVVVGFVGSFEVVGSLGCVFKVVR